MMDSVRTKNSESRLTCTGLTLSILFNVGQFIFISFQVDSNNAKKICVLSFPGELRMLSVFNNDYI